MFVYRFLLAIVVSIGTLLTAILMDMVFSPLPFLAQILLQIPILIILIDEARRFLIAHIKNLDKTLTADDINGCFFFAAPMAAFGSFSLFQHLERIRPRY